MKQKQKRLLKIVKQTKKETVEDVSLGPAPGTHWVAKFQKLGIERCYIIFCEIYNEVTVYITTVGYKERGRKRELRTRYIDVIKQGNTKTHYGGDTGVKLTEGPR